MTNAGPGVQMRKGTYMVLSNTYIKNYQIIMIFSACFLQQEQDKNQWFISTWAVCWLLEWVPVNAVKETRHDESCGGQIVRISDFIGCSHVFWLIDNPHAIV